VKVTKEKRDAILRYLYERHIFPPVHWRIEGAVPRGFVESHDLSKSILTLIVDQRYGLGDMERQSDALLGALSEI
jgi:hypothetical protein